MKIQFSCSFAHLKRWLRPAHGPQTWPWWRLVSPSLHRLPHVCSPSTGYRLWVYTRWGSIFFDIFFDRRKPT